MTKNILKTIVLIFFTYNVMAQTNISGVISSNTTWSKANSPFIISSNTIISKGVTLDIESGARIQLANSVVLRIEGQIRAVGTIAEQITFTSNNESPNKGDWGHLLFTDSSNDAIFSNGEYSSGNFFKYCTFEYGGSLDRGIISIDNSSPYFLRCIISNSSSDGINADHGAFRLDSSKVYANRKGMYLYRYPPTDITIMGNQIFDNQSGAIHFENIHDSNTEIRIDGNRIFNNEGTGAIHSDEGQNTRFVIKNNEIYNNRGLDGGAFYSEGGEITISCNIIEGNYASSGGAISIDGDFAAHNYTINNNYIFNNSGSSSVLDFSFYVTNYNTFVNISNNLIVENYSNTNIMSCLGDAAQDIKNIDFQVNGNHFLRNDCQNLIEVEYFKGAITHNNFVDNSTQYLLKNSNDANMLSINAENNYWESIDESHIQESIFDFLDNGNLSVVDYSPFNSSMQELDKSCESMTFEKDSLKISSIYSNHLSVTLPETESGDYEYLLERANSNEFNSVLIFTFDSNYLEFTDSTVVPFTQYYYRLKTFSELKISPYSEILTMQTLDTIFAPTSIIPEVINASNLEISWTDNSNNEANYILHKSSEATFDTYEEFVLDQNVSSFVDTGLSSKTNFYYQIKAINSNVESGFSESVHLQTLDTIYRPSNVNIDSIGVNYVLINWDDNSDNETNFILQRSLVEAFENPVEVTIDKNEISYLDSTLRNYTNYFYRLRAVNTEVTSEFSDSLQILTLDTIYAPSDIKIVDITSNSITLEWVDNSDNESHFILERSESLTFEEISEFEIKANMLQFRDEGLGQDFSYSYRIKAINENTASNYSDTLTLTTKPLSINELTDFSIWPNPVDGLLNIGFLSNSKYLNYEIIRIDGVLIDVPVQSTKHNSLVLDFRGQASGIYQLIIMENDKMVHFKLIKK